MEKSIWYKEPNIAYLNKMGEKTLGQAIGLQFVGYTANSITATMPVDERTIQPFGLLHGGANVALAETLGSVASLLVVNSDLFIGVGVEINANHIKAVMSGFVKGVCTPLNISGKTHVWDIKIYNEAYELTCISRFTCAIVAKHKFVKQ